MRGWPWPPTPSRSCSTVRTRPKVRGCSQWERPGQPPAHGNLRPPTWTSAYTGLFARVQAPPRLAEGRRGASLLGLQPRPAGGSATCFLPVLPGVRASGPEGWSPQTHGAGCNAPSKGSGRRSGLTGKGLQQGLHQPAPEDLGMGGGRWGPAWRLQMAVILPTSCSWCLESLPGQGTF